MAMTLGGTNPAITFPNSSIQNAASPILKVQQFTDAGSATTAGSVVNLNGIAFNYTPVSTNSTLYINASFYAIYSGNTQGGAAIGGLYGFYSLGERGASWVSFGNVCYLWCNQYSSTYAQQIAIQATVMNTRTNSSLTTRQFDIMGASSNPALSFSATQIVMQIIEVAN